jgi:hypothetical protein
MALLEAGGLEQGPGDALDGPLLDLDERFD